VTPKPIKSDIVGGNLPDTNIYKYRIYMSDEKIDQMLKEHQQTFTKDDRTRRLLWLEEELKKSPEDKGLAALYDLRKFLNKNL